MPRPFTGDRLIIASHNPGKVAEISALLAPFRVDGLSAASLGLPEPEETGDSFEANAVLKARAAAQASGLPALADNSGLVVPALGGAPGVYSARWAGPSKDFHIAMQRVQSELGDKDRAAMFVAVLALSPARWRSRPISRRGRRNISLAAARRTRVRIRPDVRAGGWRGDVRRNRARVEASDQSSRGRLRQARRRLLPGSLR